MLTASLASCRDFYGTPFAAKGNPCQMAMWGCLECPNAVFITRDLPQVLAFLSFTTVCAAEGHRSGRQRRFTGTEVKRLAAIFGVSPQQLTTQCANCGGYPPAEYACLTCGARNWQPGPGPRVAIGNTAPVN